jgi:hypothetical protein
MKGDVYRFKERWETRDGSRKNNLGVENMQCSNRIDTMRCHQLCVLLVIAVEELALSRFEDIERYRLRHPRCNFASIT